jgi:hypothetical protein
MSWCVLDATSPPDTLSAQVDAVLEETLDR